MMGEGREEERESPVYNPRGFRDCRSQEGMASQWEDGVHTEITTDPVSLGEKQGNHPAEGDSEEECFRLAYKQQGHLEAICLHHNGGKLS